MDLSIPGQVNVLSGAAGHFDIAKSRGREQPLGDVPARQSALRYSAGVLGGGAAKGLCGAIDNDGANQRAHAEEQGQTAAIEILVEIGKIYAFPAAERMAERLRKPYFVCAGRFVKKTS